MSLPSDLRFALRQFRRAPGFTAVVVAVFALGIGASTAIFSVVSGVLLRPLPYPDASRIVQFWEVSARGHQMPVADPNFADLSARSRDFDALAQMADYGESAVTGTSEPVRARVAAVSQDFFRVLGLAPARGRLFTADDQHPGAAPTAVISYGFWQRAFGGGSAALGATLHVDGRLYTVIGIAAPAVDEPVGTELWIPGGLDAPGTSRTAHNWDVIGRLRAGVTVAQAQRDVSGLMRSLKQQYGQGTDAADGALVPLRDQLTGSTRPTLLMLLGAALALLLIAATNAVNLLLARMASRQSEIGVRTALGAGRGRLVRQFMAESLTLAFAGGVLGVVLAQAGVAVMLGLQSGQIPRAADVTLDWRVIAFAFATSVLAGSAMALAAAWRGTRTDIRGVMSAGQRTLTGGAAHRVRAALVVAQFAMTLTLLVGAGLLARSFERLLSVRPGFATANAVVLDVPVAGGDSAALARRVQVYDAIGARLATIPGVAAVGAVNAMPLAPEGQANGTFIVMSSPNEQLSPADFGQLMRDPARTGQAEFRLAGPGYFKAMGIPLLAGRAFDDRDTRDAPHVALISKSLAEEKWPGRDPIGQTIQFGNMDGDLHPFTVIGVVGDVRESNLAAAPRPTFYADYRQRPVQAWAMNFVMATRGNEAAVISAARAAAHNAAPDVPARVRTIETIVSSSVADRRFVLVLVGAFGSAALLLAALGIYGVVSYLVAERRREMAIRFALGATSGSVLRMVVAQGARLAGAGVLLGALLSLAGTRLIRGFLYDVSATDPVAFIAVAALLTAVAMAASWIPARRAAAVEAGEVLR
ncbi:MAG TPA: ABC transporter permease [Gemmatimonadaceae bacterium]|nr:ABC transporter permease [Gemmatimonadaceae bacterium]